MALISIYKDVKPLTDKQVYIQQDPLTLSQIIEVIRAGGVDDHGIPDYRDKISTIRSQPKSETARLKASLNSFTVAALFKDKKGTQQPHAYNNMMVLDFDEMTDKEAIEAKERLIEWGFCLAVFISPSGKGVKAVVRFSNITSKMHSTVFGAMRLFIQEKFNLTLDPSGSDFSRLCFFSHDPTTSL